MAKDEARTQIEGLVAFFELSRKNNTGSTPFDEYDIYDDTSYEQALRDRYSDEAEISYDTQLESKYAGLEHNGIGS